MTATPIPRSLAMTVYGDLDVSVIDELPPGRTPIKTVVLGEDQRHGVYKGIEREIKLGRQIYVVYPLILGRSDAATLPDLLRNQARADEKAAGKHFGRAKSCILLWMQGGPSHIDTWDPKPGRPSGGPFGSIATKIPGVHFSSLMPHCAGIADKLNIVRDWKSRGAICSRPVPTWRRRVFR
jgi:hypothetical protein